MNSPFSGDFSPDSMYTSTSWLMKVLFDNRYRLSYVFFAIYFKCGWYDYVVVIPTMDTGFELFSCFPRPSVFLFETSILQAIYTSMKYRSMSPCSYTLNRIPIYLSVSLAFKKCFCAVLGTQHFLSVLVFQHRNKSQSIAPSLSAAIV